MLRDSHAGTQHRATSQAAIQQCGRMLAGTVPEGTRWGIAGLIVPEGEARR
ncbi:hypothetical protein [Amycolatopsis jejuensis]|uniref:hypothetical protein n=1 Tax=Amycolatopsis jejuensis TaxID=330084 RepID=UPI000A9E892E|nr:hypothetical protein [Amycolatopsis jejuensis]